MILTRMLMAALAASSFIALAGTAQAQPYPNRPIKLILPYTAGSPNDVLARIVAPHLSARLGQTIVVENRPGGGTTLGVNAVMSAEADGHTLLFSNSPTHLIAPVVNTTFTYRPLQDFVPIATVGASSNVVVIGNHLPAKTLQEFIAHAKANPGKLNFGFGQGTLPQLVGEMLKSAAGIELTNVPYRGGAQAVTDLLGGRIDINIGTASTLLPQHRAGKLRAVAYTGTARLAGMTDVPTMAEIGYPSVTSVTYYGLLGRADTPKEIVEKLNKEVAEVLKAPEVKEAINKVGFEPVVFSTRELAELFAAEEKKWTEIAKTTGFQM